MSINLEKGQKVEITKGNEALKVLKIGIGWDTNKYEGGHSFDLDGYVVRLYDGKVRNKEDLVYFNNLEAVGIKHFGDNLTGDGAGDDEVMEITLDNIDADVTSIEFGVVIYDAAARNQNFGQVSNTFIRVLNKDTDEELTRFDMGEDYSTGTRLKAGELYRHNGEWKFKAVGEGLSGGFKELTEEIGL